jgi:hypothetical protein
MPDVYSFGNNWGKQILTDIKRFIMIKYSIKGEFKLIGLQAEGYSKFKQLSKK